MRKGIVKWYRPDKGYGFLVDEDGRDVIIHHSVVPGDPRRMATGMIVEFESVDSERGPRATAVAIKKIDPIPCQCGAGVESLALVRRFQPPGTRMECDGCGLVTEYRAIAPQAVSEWNQAISRRSTQMERKGKYDDSDD